MAKLNDLRQPYVGAKEAHVQQPDGSFKIEPVEDSAGQIEFMEISFALERLVERRGREGVGAIAGNIIRVANARLSGQLEYLQTVMAGISLEEGAIGYSLLASNREKRGVGIYYIAGKLGFVMIVGDTEMCRKVRAETLDEFKTMARESWGLDLI
ncbi:hypothetical protein BJS_08857 [Bradyrhizobium japonicum SEMIA 5079]|nr:hypothetical protein BJS_08857 [Bradyrhizobium japonicum SEMIA 5079]